MPSLKDLNCSIELSDSQEVLQEFGTCYGDGFVETFVPVPSKPHSFSVHLTSNKFIAPGIAMYVFIDGVYQCNRNRQDLKLRKASDSRSLVDFKVRQKEEKQKDGSMIAREWKFEKLNTDKAPPECSSDLLANIGCIEVVVLRCTGPRNAKTASQMNIDGANDVPDHVFGFDGPLDETSSESIFDDRLPFSGRRENGFFPPPPPAGVYQPPYAETVYSGAPTSSRHSAHILNASMHPSQRSSQSRPRPPSAFGPGSQPTDEAPLLGVQYGSGPLPPVGEPFYQTRHGALAPNSPNIDSKWLDRVVSDAVKKGVAESQRLSGPGSAHPTQSQREHKLETASQPPGAWPASPFNVKAQPEKSTVTTHVKGGRATEWGQSQGGWTQRTAPSKAGTRVTWGKTKPAGESSSTANGWSTHEETPTDSWDTDETRETRTSRGWRDEDRKGRSRTAHSRSRRESRPVSPLMIRIRDQRRSKDGLSLRLRSRSRSRRYRTNEAIPSSSDTGDWAYHDTTSSSALNESSDDTIQPSHSQSQVKAARSRSKKRTSRAKSTHTTQKRPSVHSTAIHDWQTQVNAKSSPSLMTKITPTVVHVPAPMATSGFHGQPPNANFVPSPLPPAPYAPALPDIIFRKDDANPITPQPTSSPWWGGDQKAKKKNAPWGSATKQRTGWDSTDTNEKDGKGWKATDKASWSTSGGKKDNVPGGSDTDDDAWGGKSAMDKQKRKAGSLADWHTKKSGWKEGGKITAEDVRAKNLWRHSAADDGKETRLRKPESRIADPQTEPQPTNAMSTSKRHSNKTLLKYRQLRTASDTGPKPHWQFPPPPSNKNPIPASSHNGPYIAPKEPLLTISKEAASEKGVEHQVRAGKAMQYGHVVGRPEYLDALDKPYAVFRFKYRSHSFLQSLFPDAHIPSHGALTHPTPSSDLAKAKNQLKDLPQDELIEKMLRLQTKLVGKGYMREERRRSGKGGDKDKERRASEGGTEVVARGLTENWVEMQSREVSERGRSRKSGGGKKEKEKEKEKEKGEAVRGWGESKGGEDWTGGKW
ncbi:hypothetical protein NX059_003677 [Plenodomus lindquistii]|nr:hypothetical protein NX059_003677 [Plenodomus lindquistii]